MGLFDSIKVKVHCPYCGRIVDDFQTKDLENDLRVYDLGDSVPIEQGTILGYSTCLHLGQKDEVGGYRPLEFVRIYIHVEVVNYRISRISKIEAEYNKHPTSYITNKEEFLAVIE